MGQDRSSLKPLKGANRSFRQRLDWRGELTLAFVPTVVILGVMAFVEVLSQQRLLFASLASSAFLIYLDPQHGTNSVRTLMISHIMAATIGWILFLFLGGGYVSAGIGLVITIVLMIFLDVVHPPAVSTSLSFALRANNETNLVLFFLAVAVTATLVLLERITLWILAAHDRSR